MGNPSSELLLSKHGSAWRAGMEPANKPALLLQPRHCSARHSSAIGCRSQGRKCKARWRRNLTPPLLGSLAWAAWHHWHGIRGGREERPVQKHGVGCVFSPSALEPNDPASVAPSEEVGTVGQPQARAEGPPDHATTGQQPSPASRFVTIRLLCVSPVGGREWWLRGKQPKH